MSNITDNKRYIFTNCEVITEDYIFKFNIPYNKFTVDDCFTYCMGWFLGCISKHNGECFSFPSVKIKKIKIFECGGKVHEL